MRCQVRRDYTFEAARRLPKLGPEHPCGRMHGHSFSLSVFVEGDVDPQLGWVMDFAEVDAVVSPVVAEFDHQVLNDVPGLGNPTSELIAKLIWDRVTPRLPGLVRLEVAETTSSRVIYTGG